MKVRPQTTYSQELDNQPNHLEITEEMSALRKGLIEAIKIIKKEYPEIMITDFDIHRHQVSDKYVYRIGATSATYEYEAIIYDDSFSLTSRPISNDKQAMVLDLINKRNERLDDRLNCDIVTNLMRKHFKEARITDWHFDDNRFEIKEKEQVTIKNQATKSQKKTKKETMDIFWIVDLIEDDLKFRVKIDAFSGKHIKLDPHENYEIDTVASRINYYKQFYESDNDDYQEEIIIHDGFNNPIPTLTTTTTTPETTSSEEEMTTTSQEESETTFKTSEETSQEDTETTEEASIEQNLNILENFRQIPNTSKESTSLE